MQGNVGSLEKRLSEKYGVKLYLSDRKANIQLNDIIVPEDERNEGVGTKVMEEIVRYADENDRIVTLTPDSMYGGSKARLTKFYKRFGFTMNTGRRKDYRFRDTMVRRPTVAVVHDPTSKTDQRLKMKRHAVVASLVKRGYVQLAVDAHQALGLKRFSLDTIRALVKRNGGKDRGSRSGLHLFEFPTPSLTEGFMEILRKFLGKGAEIQRLTTKLVSIPQALVIEPSMARASFRS